MGVNVLPLGETENYRGDYSRVHVLPPSEIRLKSPFTLERRSWGEWPAYGSEWRLLCCLCWSHRRIFLGSSMSRAVGLNLLKGGDSPMTVASRVSNSHASLYSASTYLSK